MSQKTTQKTKKHKLIIYQRPTPGFSFGSVTPSVESFEVSFVDPDPDVDVDVDDSDGDLNILEKLEEHGVSIHKLLVRSTVILKTNLFVDLLLVIVYGLVCSCVQIMSLPFLSGISTTVEVLVT